MKENKWDGPRDWLLRRIGNLSVHAALYGDVSPLREYAEMMVTRLDDDTIVDLFGNEMALDGYEFESL